MSDVTCPRCESSRIYRETQRVKRYAYRHVARPGARYKTWAGWYVCLNGRCGHKWDGITDSGDGVLPAGVVARPEIPGTPEKYKAIRRPGMEEINGSR